MKVFELLYLLNKHMKVSITKFPKSTRYIAAAYSNVSKKISNTYDKNKTITKTDIQKLSLTDHMKNKLCILLNQKIKSTDLQKLKMRQLVADLMDLAGIGKSKADSLIKSGLKNISDLKKKKYKDQLNDATKLLMKYKPNIKINHKSIKKIEKKLTSFPNSQLVGGFRRKIPISKDIDVMIVSNKKTVLDDYLKYLEKKFQKVCVYIKGADKISLLVLIGKKGGKDEYYKVDVFGCPVSTQYAMLLYSTGSKEFNIKMRATASKMGYLLNQNGLYKKGSNTPVSVKSEKGFFDKLNMGYVKPENR